MRSPFIIVFSIALDGTSKGRNPATRDNPLLHANEVTSATGISSISHHREPLGAEWALARSASPVENMQSPDKDNINSCIPANDFGNRTGHQSRITAAKIAKSAKPALFFPIQTCPEPGIRAAMKPARTLRFCPPEDF